MKIQARLGYIVRLCLKKIQKKGRGKKGGQKGAES
jgi:hypothetical protein